MKKKHYSLEFKRKAVARLNNGENLDALIKKLKVSTSMLYTWRKKLSATPHKSGNGERDAIVFLRHAKLAMTEELKSGKTKELSKSNLYALLALESLDQKR